MTNLKLLIIQDLQKTGLGRLCGELHELSRRTRPQAAENIRSLVLG